MSIFKTKQFLPTFNLFLIFVGYQLATSLFLPDFATYEGTDEGTTLSRYVTVPYRIFALAISMIVLIQNRRNKTKMNLPIKLFFIFWGLLILRIFYDLYIRADLNISAERARETIIYVFLVCLIPALSVYKSLAFIDLKKAFNYIFFGYAILVPIFYYNNPMLFSTESADYRMSGNIAMNTIAFGHCGVTLALLAFYWGRIVNRRWKKVLSYFFLIVGVFVMLRAGSRGPLVALFACFVFYYIARQKTSAGVTLIGISFIVLLYISGDAVFDTIRMISPMLASRLTLSGTSTEYEDFSNGRSSLYDEAIARFYDSPFWGESFAIFNDNGTYIYSHNMVLDAFMALGLLGGLIFILMLSCAVINSRYMILSKFRSWWIALVCIQYLIYNMLSGAFYQSGLLNALLIITLCFAYKKQHNS